MFKFNRDGTDYEIKYENQGSDDLLVCQYIDGALTKWRCVLDVYELTHHNGVYYDNEVAFLNAFLNNLNNSLDKAHDDGDQISDKPQERLTALVIGKLVFDGKHVNIKD